MILPKILVALIVVMASSVQVVDIEDLVRSPCEEPCLSAWREGHVRFTLHNTPSENVEYYYIYPEENYSNEARTEEQQLNESYVNVC